MSVFVRTSNFTKAFWLAGALMGVPAICFAVDAPKRVVSMNLCTDQLAMLIGAKGQVISVSQLASDTRSSAMAEQATGYITNHGRAEEIYLMQPDLVLAGTYTARATVRMLERLGINVVTFDITNSLEAIPEQMTQMGDVLGQEATAARLVAQFKATLDGYETVAENRPTAALYHANGYTSGDRSLAGEILTIAGFENVAASAGYAGGGVMPLEVLAMAQPQAVIQSAPYGHGSRAEEIMNHPVVAALRAHGEAGGLTDHDWVCGTPFVLQAIADMTDLRTRIEGAAE
jgi:iron complex transport system substrate-binding protein